MIKNQHVTFNGEKWKVKGAGNQKATSLHDTQKDAIEAAKKIAIKQKSDVIIHRKDDNKIRDRDSYGNDPCPPKDKIH